MGKQKLKLLNIRKKLFRYRFVEQDIANQQHIRRILDIGCGDGENLERFKKPIQFRVGVDISLPRLYQARDLDLNVIHASGTNLPFPEGYFDLIYIAHVLHHVADFHDVLLEINRCLAPGGTVLIIETVSNNPLLRVGRKIYPYWRGDPVINDWSYEDLVQIMSQGIFQIEQSDRFNLIFFIWEILPLTFWPFEIFTPIFIYLDLLLARFFKKSSVHCYFVMKRK